MSILRCNICGAPPKKVKVVYSRPLFDYFDGWTLELKPSAKGHKTYTTLACNGTPERPHFATFFGYSGPDGPKPEYEVARHENGKWIFKPNPVVLDDE